AGDTIRFVNIKTKGDDPKNILEDETLGPIASTSAGLASIGGQAAGELIKSIMGGKMGNLGDAVELYLGQQAKRMAIQSNSSTNPITVKGIVDKLEQKGFGASNPRERGVYDVATNIPRAIADPKIPDKVKVGIA